LDASECMLQNTSKMFASTIKSTATLFFTIPNLVCKKLNNFKSKIWDNESDLMLITEPTLPTLCPASSKCPVMFRSEKNKKKMKKKNEMSEITSIAIADLRADQNAHIPHLQDHSAMVLDDVRIERNEKIKKKT